ncbi:hypothetical protein [Ilumatobacter nonamiensis]|uniref:hypothetical protein n=1 Tax=Ilumatobacter nonamiensis TaxID=467093 RepID=UPI00058B6CCC|nr:hypothetical protein [Ilumatobacter nonamiensis]
MQGLDRRAQDALVARSVIEAMNSYDRFCRYLFLSSALGARGADGERVVESGDRMRTHDEAIDRAFYYKYPHRTTRTPREELDWKVPAELIRSLRSVSAKNVSQVEAALSADSQAVHRLPVFRNFYAHRGQDTALKALGVGRQLSILGGHPTDVLLHSRDIDELVVDWLFDLQSIVDMMA